MAVRRRKDRGPDAWWLDFYVGGRRYRLTRHAKGQRAAETLERAERAAIEAAQPQQQCHAPTVRDAFHRYWREHGRFLVHRGVQTIHLVGALAWLEPRKRAVRGQRRMNLLSAPVH